MNRDDIAHALRPFTLNESENVRMTEAVMSEIMADAEWDDHDGEHIHYTTYVSVECGGLEGGCDICIDDAHYEAEEAVPYCECDQCEGLRE